MRNLVWFVTLLWAGSTLQCKSEPAVESELRDSSGVVSAMVTTPETAEPVVTVLPAALSRLEGVERAWRCAECHEAIYEAWNDSPHAKAATSEAYEKSRALAPRSECGGCHAPLEGRMEDGPAVAEGVTCEVCHRIEQLNVGESGTTFALTAGDAVKFGPRCDATDPYFHEAACRDFFTKSDICASCHWGSVKTASGQTLQVYSEYREWLDGPYAERGKTCQSCHMPGQTMPVATGEKVRKDVPHHAFTGADDALIGTGLSVKVALSGTDAELNLDIRVTNQRAGHSLPGVHRELVLEARALNREGSVQSEASIVFARPFVDQGGKQVPFFLASRAGEDTRIKPEETRHQQLQLRVPEAGMVSVRLLRYDVAPAVATQLGLSSSAPKVVLSGSAKIGALSAAGRRQVPRRIELTQ